MFFNQLFTLWFLLCLCLILSCVFHLVNDVNSILKLLSLQKGVQVVQEELQVVFSVSMGNDDGCPVPCLTVRWPVASSTHYHRIFPLNLFEGKPWWKADMDRPTCEQKSVFYHRRKDTRYNWRQITRLEYDSLWFESNICISNLLRLWTKIDVLVYQYKLIYIINTNISTCSILVNGQLAMILLRHVW